MCQRCGMNPCSALCPSQDPYGGDQAEEERDYSFGAVYDDQRERYHDALDVDDWRAEEAALQEEEDNARDVVRGDEETAPTAHVVVLADLHGECDDDGIPF